MNLYFGQMALDPSMEITVIAVRDAREALSTLKIQRNNIDLKVTDYYMPGMNGLQLKQQITRQFGNFPVIGLFFFFSFTTYIQLKNYNIFLK